MYIFRNLTNIENYAITELQNIQVKISECMMIVLSVVYLNRISMFLQVYILIMFVLHALTRTL